MARQARERRTAQAATGSGLTAEALNRQVTDGVDVILKVATKSGNLKGTFTRALKEAADGIKEAMEILLDRTTSEETKKLWEENSRLRSELEDLKREFAAQRQQQEAPAATGPSPAAPSSAPAAVKPPAHAMSDHDIERVARICMMQCGGMVSAHLEALESRLLPAENLRPPLAADRRRKEGSAVTRPVKAVRKPVDGATKASEGKGKPAATVSAPPPKPTALPATTPPAQEAWTTVVKRGRKKRAAQPAPADPAPTGSARKARSRPSKVRTPRSEAVVITLQPKASQKVFKSVLAEVKTKLNLSDFASPAGFGFRTAATGAKILEVSGAAREERADMLAAKLREVLKPEDVRVSRPTKTAELRVSGLDDSVTLEEVMAAIARNGGCTPESVQVAVGPADGRSSLVN